MRSHRRAGAAANFVTATAALADNMIDVLVNNQPGKIVSWS
jgi:hypothetical protein